MTGGRDIAPADLVDGGLHKPTDDVTQSLLNYLFRSGEVTLGSRIPPERHLAEAFGVSRTAVRESLRLLSLIGIVAMRHGAGTYLVSDSVELLPKAMEWGLITSPRAVAETMEARVEIERSVARLAALRAGSRTGTDQRLEEGLEALSVDDPLVFTAAEQALHRLVAVVADNAVLASTVVGLQALIRPWLERVFSSADGAGAREDSRWEHRAIVDAVIEGDPGEAGEAMVRHLRATGRRINAL